MSCPDPEQSPEENETVGERILAPIRRRPPFALRNVAHEITRDLYELHFGSSPSPSFIDALELSLRLLEFAFFEMPAGLSEAALARWVRRAFSPKPGEVELEAGEEPF